MKNKINCFDNQNWLNIKHPILNEICYIGINRHIRKDFQYFCEDSFSLSKTNRKQSTHK